MRAPDSSPVPSLLCTPALLWQSAGPCRLGVGAERAQAELARLAADGALVLYDPVACPAASHLGRTALPLPAYEGAEAPWRVAREIARRGTRTVAVVGGGAAMDTAKLAVALAAGSVPRYAEGPSSGLALLTRADRPAPALIALPTTLGTGSETSGVARLAIGGRRSRLVCSSMLRPEGAVLDPCLTETLPAPLLAAGAMEILLRLIGPLLGPHPMGASSSAWLLEAAMLVRHTADALFSSPPSQRDAGQCAAEWSEAAGRSVYGCSAYDPSAYEGRAELRLRLAAISAASHQVWPRVGASPFAFLLWYFADTAAAVTGTAKNTALAWLFPAYLERALGTPGRCAWADGDRARQVARRLFPEAAAAGGRPADFREAAARLLRRWGVALASPWDADPADLGHAVVSSWPRALTGLTAQDAAALYEVASAAAR